MSDNARDLLVRGMAAAKAGEKDEARRYLEWALLQRPSTEQRIQAWFYLSQVSDDPEEKRHYLEYILSAEPNYQPARRELAILEGQLDPDKIVDPDRLPAGFYSLEQAQAWHFACPQCGGRLLYTPDGCTLRCERCAQRQGISALGKIEDEFQPQDFAIAMATIKGHSRPGGERAVHCPACGAPFRLAEEDLTANCPYCQTVYVVEQAETGQQFAFEALIPFQLSQDQACAALSAWLAKRRPELNARKMDWRGFYLPAWAFLIEVPCKAPYAGRALDRHRILVPASKALPSRWAQAVQQFDLGGLKPFDAAYLADWPTETYQIPMSDASLEARLQAIQWLQETGESRGITSMDLMIEDFKLILLPFWQAEYTRNQEQFLALVNGQTGAICAQA